MYATMMLIAWLLFTLAVGAGVLSILYKGSISLYLPERLALSYALGLGAITIEMAILSAFGVKLGIFPIVACSAPLVICAFYFRKGGCERFIDEGRLSLLEKFFITAILFEILYAFFRAFIMPIESYDAVAIYGIKAKIFYLAGGIPRDFFSRFGDFIPHAEYPLLIPLSEYSIYTFLSSFNDIASKAIFPLYYVSTLGVFYCILRRNIGRKISLLFVFLLATIPQFKEYATNGYADLPAAFYYSASFFYLFLWIKEKRNAHLWLSFALSALCVWAKTEGLILFGANIIIAALYFVSSGKDRRKSCAIYIVGSVLSIAAYLIARKNLGLEISNDFVSSKLDIFQAVKRIPEILYQYQIQFFGPKKWNIAWIIFILAFIMNIKKAFSGELKVITFSILIVFVSYSAVYMLTPLDLSWHLATTVGRLFLHFLPVVLFWLAILFKEKKLEI